MPARNTVLETFIVAYVRDHPGLMRRQIARGLQKSGVQLGQQHISNRVGELVMFGTLQERLTEDGGRIIFTPEAIDTETQQ